MKKKLLIDAYYPPRDFEAKATTIAAFRKKHPGASIMAVNDREVRAMCEACPDPIYMNQKYSWDDEGCYWHKRCPKAKS